MCGFSGEAAQVFASMVFSGRAAEICSVTAHYSCSSILSRFSIMANTLMHLRARLADCKPQLEIAQRKGAETFKIESAVQRNVVVDLLQRFPLSPQDFINGTAVEIIDLVMASNLSNEDIDLIVVHLQPLVSKEHPKKGMQKSQDFLNFHMYMPEWLQIKFMTFSQNEHSVDAFTAPQLQEHLFEFLSNLGLRQGDEFTYKRMNSVLLVHTQTPERLRMLTPKCKHVLKNQLRDIWMQRKNQEKLPSLCQTLPKDTSKFVINHPDLYKAALKKSYLPKKCLLKMQEVLEFEGTYTCRNAGRPHPKYIVLSNNRCVT